MSGELSGRGMLSVLLDRYSRWPAFFGTVSTIGTARA
jgi:hypothetical protein